MPTSAPTMKAAIIALALTATTASPTMELSQIEAMEKDGLLGSKVFYKLEAGDTRVSGGEKAREATAAKVAEVLGCGGAGEHSRLFRPAGKHEAAHARAGLHLWYQTDCGQSALASMTAFAASSDPIAAAVAIVEPELKAELMVESNDELLQSQTHYPAIKLYEAWEIERGSEDVVVQVIDTGIDLTHEDLQLNIWTNAGEICGDGLDNDDNGYVDDCHGYNHADGTGDNLMGQNSHGTHCGGTISADTDNEVGVAGVAGGTPDAPGVKLMISVVFGVVGYGGFAEALVYGADNGAAISSNSWAYTAPGYCDQAILDAIDYYNDKTANENVEGLVVFAAGNFNSEEDYYPGYYDGVVAVAALQDNGVRASFSNYGSWIDIAAPGVGVLSTVAGGYQEYSGTSMACPHVAGVFALGLSADPSISKSDLLDCAMTTASSVDSLNPNYVGKLGAGLADAHALVSCVVNGAPSPAPTVSHASTTAAPSPRPTVPVPSPHPTRSPTAAPSPRPTVPVPSPHPTRSPTVAPNPRPTVPVPSPHPTRSPTAAPSPHPTRSPTASPSLRGAPSPAPTLAHALAPPEGAKLFSHKKMKSAMLASWRVPETPVVSVYKVQFKLKDTDVWIDDTPEGGTTIEMDHDGRVYYILANPEITCEFKYQIRVAQVGAASGISAFSEPSKEQKKKC